MKQDVSGVRDKPIAPRQGGVCIAEHDPITNCLLRLCSEEIRYPPSTDLPDEEHAIADPKPAVEPRRIGPSEAQHAEDQTNGKWHALNNSDKYKTPRCALAAHGAYIVQRPIGIQS